MNLEALANSLLKFDRDAALQVLSLDGQEQFRVHYVKLYALSSTGKLPKLLQETVDRLVSINGVNVRNLPPTARVAAYFDSGSPVELGLIDEISAPEVKYRFEVGDWVDAQDDTGRWWIAQITDVVDKSEGDNTRFKIQFSNRSRTPAAERNAIIDATSVDDGLKTRDGAHASDTTAGVAERGGYT